VGTLRPQIFKKEMMIALPLCSTWLLIEKVQSKV
jgi:hypothetical protein